MHDLLFKTLTSEDKKRRILTSSEIVEKQGVRSIIRRHFICMVKEIQDKDFKRPSPSVYVLREHNSKAKREKFFCKIKGSIYLVAQERLFLVFFMHSLKITLLTIS